MEASAAAPRKGTPPKAYTQLKSKAELAAQIETEKGEVAAAELGGLTELLKWDNVAQMGWHGGCKSPHAGQLVGVRRLKDNKNFQRDYKRLQAGVVVASIEAPHRV